MQTSVEFLFDRFNMLFWFHEGIPDELQEAYDEAKEIHKQEIIKSNRDGVDMVTDKKRFVTGEQYYNETFKKD